MKSVSVLIANPDATIRQCLTQALEADSRFVVKWESENGAEVLCKCRHFAPDLVILDSHLSGLDGMEVTKILRTRLSNARIIMTISVDSSRERALRSGADDVMMLDSGCEMIRCKVREVLERNLSQDNRTPLEICTL